MNNIKLIFATGAAAYVMLIVFIVLLCFHIRKQEEVIVKLKMRIIDIESPIKVDSIIESTHRYSILDGDSLYIRNLQQHR